MDIKFEITRKDYWNYIKDSFIYIPVLRYIFIGFSLVLGFLFLIPILQNPKFIIGSLVFDGIFLLIVYHVMKWLTMLLPSKRAGVLGGHIITINSEGINDSTSNKMSSTKWEGVLRIISTKNCIYVYIDNTAAYLIPQSAFRSMEDANHFIGIANEFWKNK